MQTFRLKVLPGGSTIAISASPLPCSDELAEVHFQVHRRIIGKVPDDPVRCIVCPLRDRVEIAMR